MVAATPESSDAVTDRARVREKRTRGVNQQIARNSLALLMVAQVVVILPHAGHLPLWMVAVALFCGYWRTQVYRGRWDYPKRMAKALLVAAAFGGIALSGMGGFTLEAATLLLVLAYALKLVEMKSRRDAYLVIFLSYFVIATQFLFDQSIAMALYEFVAVIVVTAAMVGLNQWHAHVRPGASLKLASALVFQALPLMVVLFVFFPRIAPLWTVPLPNGATTGLSDTMTPGDVANLSRSDELAFRVVFDGVMPRQSELYWRGLVYSEFAEGTWSMGHAMPFMALSPSDAEGTYDYEVLLEPSQQQWLFAMDTPERVSGRAKLTRDYRLVAQEPVLSVYRYSVTSNPLAVRDAQLHPLMRQRETRLPEGDNPQIGRWARQLLADTGSPTAFVDAFLKYVRTNTFSYTLRPPALPGANSVDAFWFGTRRGFCTHYAGALVFALRSAAIPARMVGGYQGGEVNPVSGHLVVRQHDAHAWVEYWNPYNGWVRVDPTAAVAPERIEQGLHAALDSGDRESLSFLSGLRNGEWQKFNAMLQWAESLEHRWNLWVVGFDTRMQGNYLRDLLGAATPARIGIAMMAGGGVALLVVAATLFWRRRPKAQHPGERLVRQLSERLRAQGYGRQPAETPSAYLLRVGQAARIPQAELNSMVERLERVLYDPDTVIERREMRSLRSNLWGLRVRLAFGAPG